MLDRKSARNVKKSQQTSGFGKLPKAAGFLVPVILVAGGFAVMKMQTGSVIQELNVTPVQQVMMQGCIEAHTAKNVTFGDNVSTQKGCACSAKLVSSVTPPAHYGAHLAVQKLAVDQYYWSFASEVQSEIDEEYNERISNELTKLVSSQNLNQKGLRHMFDYLLSADKICDTKQSYKGESLISLAALMPLETPIWESESEGVVEIALRGANEAIRVSMNE